MMRQQSKLQLFLPLLEKKKETKKQTTMIKKTVLRKIMWT